MEKHHGAEHEEVAVCLFDMAKHYKYIKKYDLSIPLMKRSLAIFEKTLGTESHHLIEPLEQLAEMYRATKRVNEAQALEQQIAKIRSLKK
jgi:hypothetical protein